MYYQNQLKFNTEMSTKPINMAVKFQQPQPLVIEKFSHVLPISATSFNHTQTALQLSTVSEEQLSMAVQLAKRDLQKQKEAEMVEKHLAKLNKGKSKGSEKPVPNKSQLRTSRKVDVKQKPKRTSQKEDKRRPKVKVPSGNLKGVLHTPIVQSTPVHSVAHEPLEGMITMSHEEFTLREIRRLKMEMDNCMNQMKKIEEVAKNGKWVTRTQPGSEDLPLEEVRRRQAEWAEKQDHQSSRVIYTLQQQVKAIQKDLELMKTPFTAKVRKDFLQRVAATYRKAVRGLQTLVNQLVDYDLGKGLPQSCHDFQKLIDQLAMCTAQLDIASSDQVPESVREVFDDILKRIEIANNLHEESGASQGRINFSKPKPTIIRKETMSPHVKDESNKQPERINFLSKRDISTASVSPERQQALRQGMEALIRATDTNDDNASNYNLQGRYSPCGKALAWEVPIQPKGQQKRNKGLLLPHSLQAKRQYGAGLRQSRPKHKTNWTRSRGNLRSNSGPSHYNGPSHYSEPTVSSKLRAVPLHSPRQEKKERPAWYSPGRSRAARPRSQSSERGVSPRECMTEAHDKMSAEQDARYSQEHHERDHGRDGSSASHHLRRNARLYKPWETAQREIHRKVQFDRQATQKPDGKQAGIDTLRSLRSEVQEQSQWALNARNRIKEDLQPILEDSQVNGNNAQQLADMILQDALDETITDLQNKEDGGDFNDNTRSLDTPTLETMLEKLQEIEQEETEIRHRWATVVYEDVNERREKFYDMDGSTQPRTPPALEITNTPSKPHQTQRVSDDLHDAASAKPIVFSRPGPQKSRYEKLQLSSRGFEVQVSKHKPPQPQKETRIPLHLSPDLVARIHENRRNFIEHLQTSSNTTVGNFNPWHLVEVMADEILEECFSDVVNEIEQIHTDIANNIYESEFQTVVSPNSVDAMIKDNTSSHEKRDAS